MKKQVKAKSPEVTKVQDINIEKINVVFKKTVLKKILNILTMEHGGFRTVKTVKNINRLFANIDLSKYSDNRELESYIWSIMFFSKHWIDGVTDPEIIAEGAKRHSEYDNIKEDIISSSIGDKNIISSPEAKMLFDLVSEALQFGFLSAIKEEYTNILDEISLDSPGAFRELANRLFVISQSMMDIKYNTNMVANKVTFNTADVDSVREALSQTITSLATSNNIFKVGIRRLNTLLSPGYMNGKIYTYIGLPASGKSLMLLKSALDIRKYNPDYRSKTPGMRPCVLYITMENTFIETIERVWSMTFNDSIANYKVEQALEMISKELGIAPIEKDDLIGAQALELELLNARPENQNIEVVMKYFPYRSISTDDLFTIIQDLKEENMEVCALILDYIKRIRPSIATPDNEKLELHRIMNELKALAVLADIPVITAHQMNRAAASIVDGAARQGKGDATKLVGREHTGTAWEIIEVSDWACVLNIEYKPGTNERYMIISVVKRRRIDAGEADFVKYTYLAHPFDPDNGLKLLDDMHIDKVLSVQSLTSDLDDVIKEKTNAVPRLKTVEPKPFIEFGDSYDDLDD